MDMDSLWSCCLCGSNCFLVFQCVTPVSDVESKPEFRTTKDKNCYDICVCTELYNARLTFFNSSVRLKSVHLSNLLESPIVVNGHSVVLGVVIATVVFGGVCGVEQVNADHLDEYIHDEVCNYSY